MSQPPAAMTSEMATKPAPPSPQKVLENDEDQTHGQMDGSWGKRVEIWDEEQQVGGEDDQFEMRSRVPHDSEPMAAPERPRSSYYMGPPPIGSAFGTEPVGQIGVHYPREMIRIERDYSGGELVQFHSAYPIELEGRITPTQFLETINGINELLIAAHSLTSSFLDNTLAVFTLYLSLLIFDTHYEKQMKKLRQLIDDLNAEIYNPRGLHILWPRKSAFLFLEIEYY